MSQFQLDVQVSRSPEPEAHAIVLATRALEAGDRGAAEQHYRELQRHGLRHPASWSNLAALGIGLGDAGGAHAHAQRALQLDRDYAEAWVNFGVASWQLGQKRDGAQAMSRALALAPGNVAAALNFAKMQQSIERFDKAREILETACRHDPASVRLATALADIARLQMDHSAARVAALRALALMTSACDPTLPGISGLRPPAGADVMAALVATCDHLQAHGVTHHLMAGTLLAIVKDGELFPHDKDVDIALPDFAPEAVPDLRAAMLAKGEFRAFPPPPAIAGEEIRAIGLVHVATGVGVDLMMPRIQSDGTVRNGLGWPDLLESRVPGYRIGNLRWKGRNWPAPEPLDQYLACIYGNDWREQIGTSAGVTYDRCYSDTILSNPSRTSESVPRAVTFGVLRLLDALKHRAWAKSVAYCAQILAREELPEVRKLLVKLQKAGHNGMRFDG